MLKVGVFGAGQLGKIHLEQWLQIPDIHVVGFFDPNQQLAIAVSKELGIPAVDQPEQLIQSTQILDITSPAPTHFDIAKSGLQHARHLYIEKPMTHTLEEAELLVNLVAEADVKCRLGHHPQYPADLPLLDLNQSQPKFIEVRHQMTAQANRHQDALIADLMLSDIDFVLQWIKAPVRRIMAKGLCVIGKTIDMATASIEFDDGSMANLTAGTIASEASHQLNIFQQDHYYQIDLLRKTANRIQRNHQTKKDTPLSKISLRFPEACHSIKSELEAFTQDIKNNQLVSRSVHHGLRVMQVAQQIEQKINYPSGRPSH